MLTRHAISASLHLLTLPGLTSYAAGLQLQQQVYEAVKAGTCPDTLIQLQHTHVYTLGKRGAMTDVHLNDVELQARGVEVHTVGRGGQVTYHGPGQAVVYPIINLKTRGLGARVYVQALEDAMVGALGCMGIAARGQVAGATGVWVGERKIGAIGVQISHGVSRHGLALNVCPDMTYFDCIIPCGQVERGVTSVQQVLAGVHCSVEDVHTLLAQHLSKQLGGPACEYL